MQPDTQLTKAVLIFTPGQYDQYYRPFEADLNGQNLNNIMIATNDGRLLTPSAMANVASSIIQPSTTPVARVPIPNGLAENRFAFLLEITTTNLYGEEREIIRGFTNYCGVDLSTGSIDPNMNFHINSRTVIKETEIMGAMGVIQKQAIRNDYSVFAEVPNMENATILRPEDAVAYQQTQQLRYGEAELIDSRSSLRGIAKLSSTSNSIPSHYLSDLCKGYKQARNPVATEFEDNDQTVYDLIMPYVRAESVMRSYFYNAMGGLAPEASHTFTFAEINRVWPRNNDFWVKSMPQPGAAIRSPIADTEHWQGAQIETQVAFSLTHILPALMTKLMLVELEIRITNMSFGNQVMIAPMNWTEMFQGTVNQDSIDYLCGQIELDIVHGLLLSKSSIFNLYLRVNLLANSHFDISLNGDNAIPYNAPMFCDSYFSPLIGMQQRDLTEISRNMENLNTEFARLTESPWENNHGSNIVAVPNSGLIPTSNLHF